MNLVADMGRHSGWATPSLHDVPYRHFEETTGRPSTYPLQIPVQTNRATSVLSGVKGRHETSGQGTELLWPFETVEFAMLEWIN